MQYFAFFKDAVFGSLEQVLIMAAIIMPLMVFLEIAKDLNVLDKLSMLLRPLLKMFTMSNQSAVPLMAGIVFGISYGAGVIIDAAKSGELTFREIYLINMFLIICHSLFEDTAIFAVLGANAVFLVLIRLVLAVIVTFILSRWKFLISESTAFHVSDKAG